jgi:hypothetical protein
MAVDAISFVVTTCYICTNKLGKKRNLARCRRSPTHKGALRVPETKVGNLSRALSDYEQTFRHPLGSYYRGDLISSDKKYFYCAECSRPGADPSNLSFVHEVHKGSGRKRLSVSYS